MLIGILRNPATRLTACYLVLFFAGTFSIPGVAEAAFIAGTKAPLEGMTPDSLAKVRAALENEYIAERLSSMGLSADEIQKRLAGFTAQERESVVSEIDSIQEGGNGIVGLLIICVLVYFILKMTDKI